MSVATEQLTAWFNSRFGRRQKPDIEAARPIDKSKWPSPIDVAPSTIAPLPFQLPPLPFQIPPAVAAPATPLPSTIDIKVGLGKRAKRWRFKQSGLALRQNSVFFKDSIETHGQEDFDLYDWNSDAFALFVQWLTSTHQSPLTFDPTVTRGNEDWDMNCAYAYILAEKLDSPGFQRHALSQTIQYAHNLDIWNMEDIYRKVPFNSPLRAFASRWVRWRCTIEEHLWDSTRDPELRADRRREPNFIEHATQAADPLATNVVIGQQGRQRAPKRTATTAAPNQNTDQPAQNAPVELEEKTVIDPRFITIEHWFQPCGRNPTIRCQHVAQVPLDQTYSMVLVRKADFQRNRAHRYDRPLKSQVHSLGRASAHSTRLTIGEALQSIWEFLKRVWKGLRLLVMGSLKLGRHPCSIFLCFLFFLLVFIAMTCALSFRFIPCNGCFVCKSCPACCHCIPCWRSTCEEGGCDRGCSLSCCPKSSSCCCCCGCTDCVPTQRWWQHHAACGCKTDRCGGAPFCYCVWCCCTKGYDCTDPIWIIKEYNLTCPG